MVLTLQHDEEAEVMEGRPTSVLPDGLVRCGECSELKGQGITPDMWREWVRIRCLCDGLICGNCGQHRIHRPISNYWAENEGAYGTCRTSVI
jgi:hypothetical protein